MWTLQIMRHPGNDRSAPSSKEGVGRILGQSSIRQVPPCLRFQILLTSQIWTCPSDSRSEFRLGIGGNTKTRRRAMFRKGIWRRDVVGARFQLVFLSSPYELFNPRPTTGV